MGLYAHEKLDKILDAWALSKTAISEYVDMLLGYDFGAVLHDPMSRLEMSADGCFRIGTYHNSTFHAQHLYKYSVSIAGGCSIFTDVDYVWMVCMADAIACHHGTSRGVTLEEMAAQSDPLPDLINLIAHFSLPELTWRSSEDSDGPNASPPSSPCVSTPDYTTDLSGYLYWGDEANHYVKTDQIPPLPTHETDHASVTVNVSSF